jgi:hypothetical protein
MRLRRRAFLVLGAGAFLGASCLSPTLPLPPPGEPNVEQVGQNQYRLSGKVPAPGFVAALNLRTQGLDGQETSDGRYSFVVIAEPTDRLRLWYAHDNENSTPVEFVIERLLSTAPGQSDPDAGGSDAGSP